MTSTMNNSEKIFSFYKLINKYRIEIPIIQRDYAQGREEQTEVRDNFLSALLLALDPKQSNLKLDFVYGSIINNAFQPLDGQQRLTTLFLLHWYAALKDNKLDAYVKERLFNFTYETRISSRDFCQALIKNDIDESDCMKGSKMSENIVNSPWFYLFWQNDPTVKAMLCMIDDIHNKFNKIANLWNTLSSDDCPIYFYFVILEDIGLTDDLYIKMNARGKLLTSFENFKAGLQKRIINNKWEDKFEHLSTFAFKIDTCWADFFWNNCKCNHSIDTPLMSFMSTIVMIDMSIMKTEGRLQWIKKMHDSPNSLRPNIVLEEMYYNFHDYFDLYLKKYSDFKKINLNFPLWRHATSNGNNNYFDQIVDSKGASYSQKVIFYAQTLFLKENESFDNTKFQEWMRVVRNILSRGNLEADGKRPDIVRSPEAFDGAINLIKELSQGCSDIYTFLSSDFKINSIFSKNQVEEERKKAKLIKEDSLYKTIIWKLEDTDLLMGRVDFAFYCCDNTIIREKLSKIADVINKYFGKDEEINPLLRRALLTIEVDGQYEYYNYWWSRWNVIDSTKRCLIDKFRVIEYCVDSNDYCRHYFKKLILKLCENNNLENLVSDFVPPINMPNWKVRLIKEPDLLSKKFSNFIAIPEDQSCCYLLKSKRPRVLDGNEKIE